LEVYCSERIMKIYAIGKVTFLQIVRQPIFGVLLLLAMGLMTLAPSITGFTLDDDDKMLQDLCLSTILVTGLVLSAFAASGAVSAEIEDQTILTVVSKPVNRLAFIVGKFLGVMVALLLACTFMTITFLMVLRHGVLWAAWLHHDWPIVTFGLTAAAAALILAGLTNYLFDWQFAPTAMAFGLPMLGFAFILAGFFDEDWKLQRFGEGYSPHVLAACVLLLLAVWMLAAVCIVCSTRLTIVWTMVIAFVVLCLGMVWDHYVLPRLEGAQDQVAGAAWSVLYAVMPNFQIFWMIDALNKEEPNIPVGYVLYAAGYAGAFVIAMVFLAFALFLERQVGAASKV